MATSKKKSTATAKKEPPKRYISAVVLDVTFNDPSGQWTLPEVLLQLFAYTPALRLREDKDLSVKYQAGDYEKEGKKVWRGRLEMLRDARTHSITRDEKRGYVFTDDESEPVTTAESTSFFAFHEDANIIVCRDSASLPYTRLKSYVNAALSREDSPFADADLTVMLRPRVIQKTIREWFNTLSSVDAVSLAYGHSRSPGNRSVDMMIEAFNAREIRETVVAAPGEELNTDALLDTKRDIGKAIDHLDKNPDNGIGRVFGTVDGERREVNTRRSVERHRVPALVSRRGIIGALVELVLRLVNDDRPDDD